MTLPNYCVVPRLSQCMHTMQLHKTASGVVTIIVTPSCTDKECRLVAVITHSESSVDVGRHTSTDSNTAYRSGVV